MGHYWNAFSWNTARKKGHKCHCEMQFKEHHQHLIIPTHAWSTYLWPRGRPDLPIYEQGLDSRDLVVQHLSWGRHASLLASFVFRIKSKMRKPIKQSINKGASYYTGNKHTTFKARWRHLIPSAWRKKTLKCNFLTHFQRPFFIFMRLA